MQDDAGNDPIDGAINLLTRCAQAKPGGRVLVLVEEARLGHYGGGLAEALQAAGARLDLRVEIVEAGFAPHATALPAAIVRKVRATDHAIFFCRLGDQLRFRKMPAGVQPIVGYTLDGTMLGSAFGRADHRAMTSLKIAIDAMIARAEDIHISCPLGTDFRGAAPAAHGGPAPDVTVRRFPMSVFAPVSTRAFRGRIAVARFLVGSGSNYYEPYALPLSEPVTAHVENGRLLAMSGDAATARDALAHHEHVGRLLGVDPRAVHSWHAGIHPGCDYAMPALANPGRWSGGAFGNPRVLHFHACGDYAPGEICWNVIDATVRVDGVAVWEGGRLHPERVPGGDGILRAHAGVAALFAAPAQRIGL